MKPSFTLYIIIALRGICWWLTGLFQVTNIIFVFESLSTLDSTFTSAAKLLGPEFAGNIWFHDTSHSIAGLCCKRLLQV